MPPLVEDDRLEGMHVYVPIVRGPVQKEVWTFAKALRSRAGRTASGADDRRVRVAKRPHGRVLVDYNQNAWGARWRRSTRCARGRWRRCRRRSPGRKSTGGCRIEDFRLDNVRARLAKVRRPVEAAAAGRAGASTSENCCGGSGPDEDSRATRAQGSPTGDGLENLSDEDPGLPDAVVGWMLGAGDRVAERPVARAAAGSRMRDVFHVSPPSGSADAPPTIQPARRAWGASAMAAARCAIESGRTPRAGRRR